MRDELTRLTAAQRRRGQRLAVMVLFAGLVGLALLAQPPQRDATPARLAAIRPAPAVVAPATPPAATAAPAEAAMDPDPEVLADVEHETQPALPAVPEPGDIVVALVPPTPDEWAPRPVTFVHTSESAQPEGPPPAGGTAGSAEGMEGPEPGALYWFGPQGLVRLAREARQ